MTSLRTHLPRRPLFRALLLAGAAVAGSLAVIGTPSDIPAEASADDPWTLPVPPERTHLMLGSRANWAEPCLGPTDKTFDAYPSESIAAWHERLGMER